VPKGATVAGLTPDKPFVASMGVYVFSRDVLMDLLAANDAADFGREIIPSALDKYRVNSFTFRGYWADVGTIDSFYDANIMLTKPGSPFRFYDPHRPIFTHPRFLPGSRLVDARVHNAIVSEGCYLGPCTIEESIIGIRTHVQEATTITRSVLLGADYYEADNVAPARGDAPRLGIGRGAVLDRVIVDKNARIGDGARLTNAAGVDHADGDGYHIRNGIIIVPKDGIIASGTVV
jgi:glucose-1-phosphate adenylyltransferase